MNFRLKTKKQTKKRVVLRFLATIASYERQTRLVTHFFLSAENWSSLGHTFHVSKEQLDTSHTQANHTFKNLQQSSSKKHWSCYSLNIQLSQIINHLRNRSLNGNKKPFTKNRKGEISEGDLVSLHMQKEREKNWGDETASNSMFGNPR